MRESLVAAIGKARADLLTWLDGLAGDDWATPTVCDPWTVKDVLAHMVEGEVNVGRIYRGEVAEQGSVDPEEGVARWSALPGVAVRAALWQHGIATQRVLETMTDEAWERPIRAFGCRRVPQLARIHLFDLVVHGHDLTDAMGAPPLWTEHLPFLTEYVVRAAPATLTRRGLAPAGRLRVAVPSLEATWLLNGEGEAWELSRDEGEAPTTLTIEQEPLVLTATGRGGRDARYAATGDRALVEQVLAAWRVV